MPNQAFTEMLTFTRCANWNTDTCPHLKNPQIQLSIINAPHFWLLNDKTVDRLTEVCKSCSEFRQIARDDSQQNIKEEYSMTDVYKQLAERLDQLPHGYPCKKQLFSLN